MSFAICQIVLIVANFAKTPQILCAILLNNHLIPPSETESHEKDNRLVHRKQFTNKNGKNQTIRTQGFTRDSFKGNGFDRIVETLRS